MHLQEDHFVGSRNTEHVLADEVTLAYVQLYVL